ncbi:hypothetical protein KIS4809_5261 [Bacillus sp. ZZV12-4809]|nr:hypothetical protein KIS4809_5261 [Bacillus sp. ZZV12-4809]
MALIRLIRAVRWSRSVRSGSNPVDESCSRILIQHKGTIQNMESLLLIAEGSFSLVK